MRTVLAALLLLLPASASAQPTPEALSDAFVAAVGFGDEAATKALFEVASWDDSAGRSVFRQSQRKGFTFGREGVQRSEGRAVVTLDIIVDRRPVDRIYLYAQPRAQAPAVKAAPYDEAKGSASKGTEKVPASWAFLEVDESEAHVKAFLAGKVPARLDLRALPAHDALNPVAEALMALAAGKASPAQRQRFVNTDDGLSGHVEGMVDTKGLWVKRVGWLDTMQRGTLTFGLTARGVDPAADADPFGEQWWVYVEKVDGGWRAYWHGTMSYLDAFLR